MRIPRNAHEPIPFGLPAADIRSLAEGAAGIMGYEPGTPVAQLVQDRGGRIAGLFSGDIVETDADGLIVYDERDFIARIKDPFAPARPDMNFELAILVGYLTLHHHRVRAMHGQEATMVVPYYARTARQKTCFQEAFHFAVGLLCPRSTFEHRWRARGGNTHLLSTEFGVPTKHVLQIRDLLLNEDRQAA